MAKAVFGIAKSESQAIAIADQLRAAAFPDKQGTKDFAHEQHTRDSQRRDGCRNCRRGSGRCVGMDGIGALAIPDLSPLSWPI
jgi:hypothetical protein